MSVTQRQATTVAGLGSAALLAGAFAFQYLGGLPPCQLCLWQRWPHAAAVLILGLIWLTGWRWLAWLALVITLSAAATGLLVDRGILALP